jgi:large repetitive protein
VYTTGYFQGTVDFDSGTGTFNLTSAGSGDIFVEKLDVNGNFVWAKNMGGTGSDEGYSITVDASGNVYTMGRFEGTVDFDPGSGTFSLTSAGSADIFVQKLEGSSCSTISISPSTLSNGVVGSAYNQTLTQTGLTGTPTWSVSAGTLPTGLTLNTTSGTISGTPTALGTFNFTVQVTDETCSTSQAYSITVNCPNITFTNTTASNATVGSAYSLNAGVTGNTQTVTYSVSPALPAGLSLNTSTGTISGTPTATATSTTYTVTASQSSGVCIVTQNYTFSVVCPTITITPATLTAATIGSAYSQTISQTGLTGTPAWSVSAGTLPTGLSINSTSGVISGTPTATETFNFTVQVTNGTCSQTNTYSIVVSCPTISISPSTLSNGIVGSAYNQTLTQTGLTGTPAWSVSAGTLPTGLSLNTSSGVISGTPTALGTFNFTVQVTNGSCSQTQAYSITVNCPNITFTNTTASNATVGSAYSLNASVTGNTQTVTYSVSPALPAGLSLNTSTGAISGTPTATAAVATYTVTASQSSGVCTVTQNYTFSVVCSTISISPSTLSNGVVGSAYSQTLTQTGLTGTPTWSVSAGTLPTGLTLNATSGVISGTPTATGTFNFTVQVTDGTCSTSQAYTVAVNCTGVSINPATLPNANQSTAYSQTLTQTGLTGTPTWSVSVGTLPTGLSLNSSTGVISGTPTASGTFNFTVQVTNGTCSATRAYTIVVTASGPILQISLTELDFGDVLVLQSSKKTITVKNMGTSPLSITSINMPNIVFSVESISGTIAPQESRNIEITFTPTALISYNGTVSVNSNATTGVNTFAIKGRGVNPTALNPNQSLEVNLYPNPSQDVLEVSLKNISNFEWKVTDMLGRTLLQGSEKNSSVKVQVSTLPTGQYLLWINNTTVSMSKSFIKQ